MAVGAWLGVGVLTGVVARAGAAGRAGEGAGAHAWLYTGVGARGCGGAGSDPAGNPHHTPSWGGRSLTSLSSKTEGDKGAPYTKFHPLHRVSCSGLAKRQGLSISPSNSLP